ncbi:MAG: hypothetical protein LBV30_07590 [Propionibacteriaceae bacterium]|nr:hypothetical protein [Propionibacteriaceae bacterium]
MLDAGVPVIWSEDDPALDVVVMITPLNGMIERSIDGLLTYEGVYASAESLPTDAAYFVQHGVTPGVFVDGHDYSAALQNCRAESSYDEAAAWQAAKEAMPAPDPSIGLRQLAANNRWAACARDNGWLQIADVTTTGTTVPAVSLPDSVSLAALDALLDTCPLVDLDSERQYRQWLLDDKNGADSPTTWPDWYFPMAEVAFAWTMPNQIGSSNDPASAPDQATKDALQTALSQRQRAELAAI